MELAYACELGRGGGTPVMAIYMIYFGRNSWPGVFFRKWAIGRTFYLSYITKVLLLLPISYMLSDSGNSRQVLGLSL